MELNQTFRALLGLALVCMFFASAALLSIAVDYTAKHGLVVNEKLFVWAVASSAITLLLWLFSRKLAKDGEASE